MPRQQGQDGQRSRQETVGGIKDPIKSDEAVANLHLFPSLQTLLHRSASAAHCVCNLTLQSKSEWASSGDVTRLALAMCSDLTWLSERERDRGLNEERYRERRRKESRGGESLIYNKNLPGT